MQQPQESNYQVVPIILSGGSGTRLWPKSRKAYPKQLHKLYGDYTMLQHTVKRVKNAEPPIVVCNESQRFMVAEQLSEVCAGKPSIILEPTGRNTAPAIAVAAMHAQKNYPNPILVVLAADHLIKDESAFNMALDKAINEAQQSKLVAFGIVPDKPETGYGYINAKAESEQGAVIEKFVEKPSFETAQAYVASGEYFWNSGMFVFGAGEYLNELNAYEAELVGNASKALQNAKEDLDFIRLERSDFELCNDISIDYAVMEKTAKAWMVPLKAGWSDLGSWQSLWEALDRDESGNVCKGDVILDDCKNSLFFSESRLVTGVGLEDLVVVDTDDSLLIAKRDKSQDVKNIVDELKKCKRSESDLHRKVYRPWGSFDSVDTAERYQVKRIEVKPGASLSLQMHHHRAEHWVVVKGTALVQKGDDKILISENQSIYIPLGEKHRLSNPGKLTLHLIEVSSGSYLGEDDIIRIVEARTESEG